MINAKHVALIKHRCLKRIRSGVERQLGERSGSAWNDDSSWDAPAPGDALLTEIWESQRLSCPKRSTIGAFVLATLEAPWQDYVEFHVNRLGCRFCRAGSSCGPGAGRRRRVSRS